MIHLVVVAASTIRQLRRNWLQATMVPRSLRKRLSACEPILESCSDNEPQRRANDVTPDAN